MIKVTAAPVGPITFSLVVGDDPSSSRLNDFSAMIVVLGVLVKRLRCEVLDETAIDELKFMICDRLTPEELIEVLGMSTADVFDRFRDEILELDLSEVL
jgi:hypothetical protein